MKIIQHPMVGNIYISVLTSAIRIFGTVRALEAGPPSENLIGGSQRALTNFMVAESRTASTVLMVAARRALASFMVAESRIA